MNRKITVLMIAVIASILPAVAIADVMITGNFTIESGSNNVAWYIQPGPNYARAYDVGAISWTPSEGPSSMGQLDLQGMQYEDTWMINVLDLNFSLSPTAIPGTFSLYLNFSDSTFPVGTIMAISTQPITFAQLMAASVTHYTAGDPSIVVNAGSLSTLVLVDLSENPHLVMNNFPSPFDPAVHYYTLSFVLPANYYGAAGATLTGQFVTV